MHIDSMLAPVVAIIRSVHSQNFAIIESVIFTKMKATAVVSNT